uniref:Uncharacterized protein n=1 Tax=Arion vulgaris TaxID=1028688 RepID=A0A0B7AJA6_9EUPU
MKLGQQSFCVYIRKSDVSARKSKQQKNRQHQINVQQHCYPNIINTIDPTIIN